MKETPFVSIIIPFYNEGSTIKDCLETVKTINYPKYEVIFVDDGSTDNSPNIIKKCKDKRMRLLRGEHEGVAKARNIGIKNSKGEILVFTDADCMFDKDWLIKLIKPLIENPKVGVTGGPDKVPKNSSLMEKCIDFAMTSLISTGGLRGGNIILGDYYPRGCNMALKRTILDKVGLFNPDFKKNRGEEAELEHRIKKAGYDLLYVKDAFVWHRRRSSIKKFWKQNFASGYAYIIRTKYSKSFSLIHFIPSLFVLSLFLLFIMSFFYKLFFNILLFIIGIYLIFLLIQGIIGIIKIKNILALPIVIFVTIITHISYGLGLLYKLFLVLIRKKSKEISG